MDTILGEVTIRQRRKKLDKMTHGNGLEDAYTATLTRLRSQKGHRSVLGLKVLMWVLHSERPLRSQELCHALGVEIGSTDLDPENVPALRTLVASCLGLVTVEASSLTFRLVHYTLQEHLSRNPTLFHSPHSTIAEVCLTYLNFGCVRDLPTNSYRATERLPLLEYASVYWGRHTRKEVTENVKILALRLLDKFGEHISAHLLLLHRNQDNARGPYDWSSIGPMGFTGLHGAAYLDIPEIVSTILKMKECDVNAGDYMGTTALIWASARGHEEVVKVLLDQEDINPNQADTNYGPTPLTWAARSGHKEVVKMLLEREDVNPNQADTDSGHTPLTWAANSGHQEIVKMLLEREGVNPNQADTKFGQTPLTWAAMSGHKEIVKMLLEREDVNPNQADTEYGRTPLLWASYRGRGELVMILLQREDVNPNQADTEYGRTPLLWAADDGDVKVVKILLQRSDIHTATPDNQNQTPLSLALSKGYHGVAKILREWDNANSNTVDSRGRSSLPPAGSRD